jgi:mRNA interferase MazF
VILTRQEAIAVLNAYVTAPATRTVRGIPTEVPLGPEDGMPELCVVNLDNVGIVPKEFFRERICRLGPERMAAVCRALAVATAC